MFAFHKPTLNDVGHVFVAGVVILSIVLGRPAVIVIIHLLGLAAAFAFFALYEKQEIKH